MLPYFGQGEIRYELRYDAGQYSVAIHIYTSRWPKTKSRVECPVEDACHVYRNFNNGCKGRRAAEIEPYGTRRR